ncbi:GTPase domain-containing protein [Gordonia rhizosphera]|uniref:Uncharacterized protein n=1 Tax=Gordonia rhizosphera NBRC 16068 TaxID=1108045 RepID=K6W727_9ACTN|nr:GTPase domain-containing protein [Gordonia rhizosphera]GAB89531.1 hypothetical protein GORHZ_064_00180 [Gordonia rhizosphera NBRC 16068]
MTRASTPTDIACRELVSQVRGLTGFDAAALDGRGATVSVHGIGGTGVTTLIEACRAIDATVVVRKGCWGPQTDDPTVGIALLVVDPTSSVAEEEKRAVEQLRVRFGIVALVCTKIDAFWEWPRILRDHRALLDPHHRLPVFAVSSTAALAGAVDDSGIPALLAWITEHLGAPDELRSARAQVAAALGAVEHAEAELTAQTGPAATESRVQQLTARRRRLVESRDRGRADRLASARAGLTRARGETLAEVAAGTRALAAAATTRCRTVTAGTADDYANWLSGEMGVFGDQVDRATDERIVEVRAATMLGIDAGAADPDDPDPHAPDPTPTRPVPSGRRGGEDAILVLIGASTGLGVGRLIVAPMAGVQTLQWVSMPLTLILGVAVAAWVIRVRRTAALRSEIRAWSTDAISGHRNRLEHRAGMRLSGAEPRLISQVNRHYDRRARQLGAEVAEIDEALRATRAGPTQDQQTRLRRIRTLHRDLAGLSADLAGTDREAGAS